jgi:hypothetical protein
MSELWIALGVVWGVSAATVAVLVALDERAHRRSGSTTPPRDAAIRPVATAARPQPSAHADHALA